MSSPHTLRWVAADSFVASPVSSVPSILRFSSDDFMDRMLRTLSQRPQDLPEFRAKPEGWEAPRPVTAKLSDPISDRKPAAARALERRTLLKNFERKKTPVEAPRAPEAPPLKLFQPVHQRFYLAAAHLVCELPGLPPRASSPGDRSGFVVRRLFTGASGQSVEHGFVKGADGRGVWVPIATAGSALASGEELLPVFPMGYAPPTGPQRSLSGGLIPVSQHDAYVFAGRVPALPASPTGVITGASVADQLKALALTKIITPWQALLNTVRGGVAMATAESPSDAPWEPKEPADPTPALIKLNDQLVDGSWRVLQEMREWVQAALPTLLSTPTVTVPVTPAQTLLKLMEAVKWPTDALARFGGVLSDDANELCAKSMLAAEPPTYSLLNALGAIGAFSEKLDGAVRSFPNSGNWPDFAFPLALGATDGAHSPLAAIAAPAVDGAPDEEQASFNALLKHHDPELITLLLAIHAAIDEANDAGELPASCPQASSAAQLAKSLTTNPKAPREPARFVLRFVHVRCDCGPLSALVLSEPSEVFQLAGFFDPEAPLRPIRIALPFDTTPGGLRKYAKNSAFIVSDVLCGQMKRVRSLGFGDLVLSVLPWPFHKDLKLDASEGPCGDDASRFGMICSLSIPIITLVAFVLLIVIAAVLDLIFHWLPFLMVCFPVPGLKAKNTP